MAIELSKETEEKLVASIKRYFADNLDQEIGDLKASMLLDFCLKEVGPSIYNQAVADAQAFIHDKLNDLDGSCWESEFDYWKED